MPPVTPSLRDRLCVAAFCLLWLAPLVYHGFVRGRLPGEPGLFHDWHTIACLFPERPDAWNSYHIEVRRRGAARWEELDESLDFPMEPFGHRTRMYRYLNYWGRKHPGGYEELAAYLVARDRQRGGDTRPIIGVRFVWGGVPAPLQGPITGEWQKPPLTSLPANHLQILSTHRFDPEAAP